MKMRISKKKPLKWFIDNFGLGGTMNYDAEQVRSILKSLKNILENTGYIELQWLGKFLIKLSNNPVVAEKFLKSLNRLGY